MDKEVAQVNAMRKKILFYCSRFGGGGAEMHLLRILSHADLTRYDIHLALTRDGGNYEERLPAGIAIHHLNTSVSSSTKSLLSSVAPLKKLIGQLQPQAVVSFMDPQNAVLCYLKKKIENCPPVILCCQNAPRISLAADGIRGKLILMLIKKWYNRADKIIAICKGVGDEFKNLHHITAPVEVIYNAGFDECYKQMAAAALPVGIQPKNNQLIAAGRLTKQKGFDILLEACAQVNKHIDVNLWILGAGKDRPQLEELAGKLNLTGKVNFLGFQPNPYAFFSRADVFVLSSRWEGFGNVITEAMVCGTAVVATNCNFGPAEIIANGVNGLLCDINAADIALKLEEVLINSAKRKMLAENGKERAAFFAPSNISKQYFAAIESVL